MSQMFLRGSGDSPLTRLALLSRMAKFSNSAFSGPPFTVAQVSNLRSKRDGNLKSCPTRSALLAPPTSVFSCQLSAIVVFLAQLVLAS
jgi:hypothetical protein